MAAVSCTLWGGALDDGDADVKTASALVAELLTALASLISSSSVPCVPATIRMDTSGSMLSTPDHCMLQQLPPHRTDNAAGVQEHGAGAARSHAAVDLSKPISQSLFPARNIAKSLEEFKREAVMLAPLCLPPELAAALGKPSYPDYSSLWSDMRGLVDADVAHAPGDSAASYARRNVCLLVTVVLRNLLSGANTAHAISLHAQLVLSLVSLCRAVDPRIRVNACDIIAEVSRHVEAPGVYSLP